MSDVREIGFRAYLICQWIFLSSTIILFNKYLLSTVNFHFPLSLVILHMVFISVCAFIWKRLGWVDVPEVAPVDILTRFAPVALCFALSLGLGNAAYLYISVAFVQMLKASTPVAVLLASFAFELEKPNVSLFTFILFIATGVATSAYGQLQLNVIGVVLQMAAVVCEAMRLCLVNIALTSKGFKLSPIAFLYFVAPLCVVALLPAWLWFEASAISHNHFGPVRRTGVGMLLLNSSVAFFLNLATMALIKNTSALTLNVAGVFKDVLLIIWSVLISGAVVTHVQYVGYGIALVGVCGYSSYKRAQQQQQQQVAPEHSPREPEKQPLAHPSAPSETDEPDPPGGGASPRRLRACV